MRLVGLFKPDRLMGLLHFIGVPVVVLYSISMFFVPWLRGHGDWLYVQDVWDRWQGLNVGMLAFVSSVVAFNISRFNAEHQRQRDFLASKAFLPAALSELVEYFKRSASVLVEGWESAGRKPLGKEAPGLPDSYKAVFEQCIRHADPNVGDYLSRILVQLQVHDARLRDFVKQFDDRDYINPDKHNLITYLYRLGELQALVNNLFEFARNDSEFDSSPMAWEDFHNAFGNLDIFIEDFHIDEDMNLEAFTKRAIKRGNGRNT